MPAVCHLHSSCVNIHNIQPFCCSERKEMTFQGSGYRPPCMPGTSLGTPAYGWPSRSARPTARPPPRSWSGSPAPHPPASCAPPARPRRRARVSTSPAYIHRSGNTYTAMCPQAQRNGYVPDRYEASTPVPAPKAKLSHMTCAHSHQTYMALATRRRSAATAQ